jgi:DNA-binding MarR family transcriptional regulator
VTEPRAATPSRATTRSRRSDSAQLAAELSAAVNRLAHALRAPAVSQGITPTRLTALAMLDRHGRLRPGDLAARLNITAASMSRLTEVLEQGGWINRDPDPADRRACLLELSDHGRATLAGVRRENITDLTTDISELTGEQRAALEAALPVLALLAERRLEETPRG